MIQALSEIVGQVLNFFYDLVNNYGLSIIMLTILVNIITYPLTRKQLQSSKKLQEIQPELNKIKQKYKNDKEQMNKATMEFMSKNKVNPLGGCLPLIVQLPIMIAVFQLLRDQKMLNMIRWVKGEGAAVIESLGLHGVSLRELPTVLPPSVYDSIPSINSSFLIWDLMLSDPLYILPIMAAATTFIQQRMMITDPSQKMLMYIFPVMILVISVSLPAGLILYWFTNSLISIGNYTLMKRNTNPLAALTSKLQQDKAPNDAEKSAEAEEESEEPEELNDKEIVKKDKKKSSIEKLNRELNQKEQSKNKAKKTFDKSPKKKTSKAKKKGADK